jgi:hypothetical protein
MWVQASAPHRRSDAVEMIVVDDAGARVARAPALSDRVVGWIEYLSQS